MKYAKLFFSLLSLITPTTDTLALSAKIIEFGIYDVPQPAAKDLPGSLSGKEQTGKGELIKETNVIPLIKDTFFGFKYEVTGFKNNQPKIITLVIKHPPIITPEGKVKSTQLYQYKHIPRDNAIRGHHGYVLNREYELVTGSWVFQIWHDKKLVVEQRFTTVVN